MAFNTSHLQGTLDTWKKQSGREVDPKLQHFISPMGFEHINFNGVISFRLITTELSCSRRDGVLGPGTAVWLSRSTQVPPNPRH